MAANNTEEENHWPGYVDALTTMTMMLIFIMTILAIAIFGMSQNVSRSVVEKIAKAANVEAGKGDESIDDLASRVVARIEIAGRPAETPTPGVVPDGERLASSSPSPERTAPGGRLAQGDAALITISYQPRATALDDETTGKIRDVMNQGDRKLRPLEIRAYTDRGGAISDGRRIAFYRLLNLRNQLIAMGVPPARIRARIAEATTAGDGDLVRIDLGSAIGRAALD